MLPAAVAAPLISKLMSMAMDGIINARTPQDVQEVADTAAEFGAVEYAIDCMELDQLRELALEVSRAIDRKAGRKPNKFGATSQRNLATIHPTLQTLLNDAIHYADFSVIQGQRGEEEQNRMVKEGKSQLAWPKSKHNTAPSLAVDLMPWVPQLKGRVWEKHEYFYHLAGVIQARAAALGIAIRWGGDWSGNGFFGDQTFNDLPHIELVGEQK